MLTMKKALIICSAVVAALAVAFGISTNITRQRENKSTDSTPSASVVSTADNDSREPVYVIKEIGDKVAVFRFGEEQPFYTLERSLVQSLPQYDQKLLKAGIKVYSNDELQALIEDYDS